MEQELKIDSFVPGQSTPPAFSSGFVVVPHTHNGLDSSKIASSSGAPAFWYLDADVASGGTQYFCFNSISATEADVQIPMPIAGTIGKLYLTTTTAQPASGSSVFTLRKNGADTTVIVTIAANAAAGTYSDLAHSFNVVAGDLIDIKWVNNASATSTHVRRIIFSIS